MGAASCNVILVIVRRYDLIFIYVPSLRSSISESRYAYLSNTVSRILLYTHAAGLEVLIKNLLRIASALVEDLRSFWAPLDSTEVLRTTVVRSSEWSYLLYTHCSWLREGDYAALDLTCLLASPLTIECLKRQSVTFVTFSILQQVGHAHMTNSELGGV